MKQLTKITFSFIILLTLLNSCKKYLEAKPDAHLVTPARLNDLQAILDYTPHMLIASSSDEASADNYTVGDDDYASLSEDQRRIYTWQPDYLFSSTVSDWAYAYRKVYICNTVMDGLGTIPAEVGKESQRNDLLGQALMIRGAAFFSIANIWAPAYDAATASKDLGIPLRLTSNFQVVSVRASVVETFQQIITDLKKSIALLPVLPVNPVRASRPAAYAWLSRVYLAMRRYPEAGLYADSCLQLQHVLMDYNNLDSNQVYPIPEKNTETIFELLCGSGLLSTDIARIDPALYNSYLPGDLRKSIFFKPNGEGYPVFKGNYSGSPDMFAGLATDEVYLTRAECFARAGNVAAAMNDLNTLLVNRFQTGAFVPLTATDAADALEKVLVERRKELVMRFVRFMDLKRLNKEGAGISILRVINGEVYTLQPNDLRYALPLPEDVLALTGMPQNPR